MAPWKVSGRGGSSAMPGKRNPTGCQVALSAALRAPGLAATLLGAMPQELERGLGGWQAEAAPSNAGSNDAIAMGFMAFSRFGARRAPASAGGGP